MPRVYVSIGSNIDREANIRFAVAGLRQRYGELILSSVYESRAVGFDGNNFYNLVVGFDTGDEPRAVVKVLRAIEDRHGRDRKAPPFSSRTLDIDLLLYGDRVLRDQGLDIPRDEITRHAFVLCPLTEIAPDLRHPEQGVRMTDLWRRFDKADNKLWKVDRVQGVMRP